MLIVIIVILGFLLYSYIRDTNNDKNKLISQGGIKNKYSILISQILVDFPKHKIDYLDERKIEIGGFIDDYKLDYLSIVITNKFNKVFIDWKLTSSINGIYEDSYTYDDGYNQILMIQELELKLHNLFLQLANIR